MILHGPQLRMSVLDPEFHFLQLFKPVSRHENLDPLQVVGQHLERSRPLLTARAIDQRWFHVNGPAFDFADQGIEAYSLNSVRLSRRFAVSVLPKGRTADHHAQSKNRDRGNRSQCDEQQSSSPWSGGNDSLDAVIHVVVFRCCLAPAKESVGSDAGPRGHGHYTGCSSGLKRAVDVSFLNP
jgi:hypothetical protein